MLDFKVYTRFLCVSFFLIAHLKVAQNPTTKRHSYKIWITEEGVPKRHKGLLYAVEGDDIVLSRKYTKKLHRINEEDLFRIPLDKAEQIKVRRRGRKGLGVAIGAGLGITLGAVMGLASGDDEAGFFPLTKEEKAAGLGVPFALIGATAGLHCRVCKKEKVNLASQKYARQQLVDLSLMPIVGQ